ncbi:MAG: hypothetical protein JWM78_2528 [Verrucomicrobiaceae bacterium]|nr:hypothetical protein [Verrucomicrobiaceae bacterium]
MSNSLAFVAYTQIALLLLMSLPMAVTAFKLAREKGRNVPLWTIIACIPILNFMCMWYFVGAVNLKTERKLDELLQRLNGQQ